LKNKSSPYFSVIIPCYNVAESIYPTFECLTRQSFKDFEVIFVNDGSIDSTQDLLESFSLSQKIVIIKQYNKGLGAARNVGIKASSGKFISLLDADDIWEDNKLKMVYDYLQQYDCEVVCHNEYVVNESHKILKNNYYGPYTKYDDLFFKNNCLSPSAVTIKRNVIDSVGYFTENLQMHGVEDYDMWLRMALVNVDIKYIPEFLGSYVIHGNNMSTEYKFFDKIETLHFIHAVNIDLNNNKNALRYKIKLLKLYLSKLKAAVSFFKFIEIYIIFKDMFLLIFLFDQFIATKTKR
jgi:glycosyltransferase involved in cell wall biosynthesis